MRTIGNILWFIFGGLLGGLAWIFAGCMRSMCQKLSMNNIVFENGKPIWGNQCTHCMACICYCSTEAIEYGKKNRKAALSFAVKDEITPIQDFYNPICGVCCLRENVFYAYFPNVLLDLAAALAAMVLVDSNKEVVGATGHISTRPVPR